MSGEFTQPPAALAALEQRPPSIRLTPLAWMRRNLFNTWYNTIYTLVSLWIIYAAADWLITWGVAQAVFSGADPQACQGISGACWPVINDNFGLFMVGPYPFDLRWRPVVALCVSLALTFGALIPAVRGKRWFHVAVALGLGVIFLFLGGWEAVGLRPVETRLWGGLMLTIILSIFGIVFAFPIGILLALGRRSRMPVIKALSVGYIELIRGVPLITILFMSSIMFPLFFPEGFNLDKLLRAQVGIIMFAAAYQAEVVRGGLQALSRGQEEAAAALGLNYFQSMGLIILPQALRIVIPTMVSNFIGLLKDTSLVVIIGLFDMLGIANLVLANPIWLGKILESYIFVAAIYWVLCFSMSRMARNLEIKYQTGHD